MQATTVRFAGKDTPIKELIARCLAVNYLQFGFADGGEADLVAERLLGVLASLKCEIVQNLDQK